MEGSFVLESPKGINELIRTQPASIQFIVTTQKGASTVMTSEKQVPVYHCSETVMGRLTDTSTPQELLAVVRKPCRDSQQILGKPDLFSIYGETIQDPANVGVIVRLAAAFGVDAVWLSPASADPFNPKAIRASAGTWLGVPIFTDVALATLIGVGIQIYAADSGHAATTPLGSLTTRPSKLALAFGSEGRGLSQELRQAAVQRYTIRTEHAVESLNVASAAAIAIYHFRSLPLR